MMFRSHQRKRSATGMVRVIHPFPVVMVIATSILLTLVLRGGGPGSGFLLRVVLVVLTSQIAIGALNDYRDRFDDALGQPGKPIPSGKIAPGTALWMVRGSLLTFLPLALSFGPLAFCLIAFGTFAGISYDLWLKRTAFSVLGYIAGFLSLFTWIAVITGEFSPRMFVVYPVGALIVVVAHLAQSFPDIETDSSLGQHGLAVVLGPLRTLRTIRTLWGSTAGIAIVVSLAVHSPAAAALAAIGSLIGAAGLLSAGNATESPPARRRLFLTIAPSVALLALSCLLSIR
ncbi:MAG: UbiA family prenyltransferase [Chloroflexota bacterium]